MFKKSIMLVMLSLLVIMAFRQADPSTKILELVLDDYLTNLNAFDNQVKQLLVDAEKFKANQLYQEALQKSIVDTRKSYKKVEHLLEYFQVEDITRYINGAPLPKVDDSAPGLSIIPPFGLQTLDEAIFSEEADAKEILHLAQQFNIHWRNIFQFEKKRKRIQHRYIFESQRYQIIRIFTLGLTGFDTPGSVNAIPEALASLKVMHKTFSPYLGLAPKESNILTRDIKAFIDYLEANNDFDTLDRLYALRTFINPIYSGIYNLQKATNTEFVEEVDPTLKPVNYHSQHIFDHNFLNKSYYAQVAISDLDDDKKIALGKTLFFDPALSKDFKMSCASCHNPDKAFTDGLAKSQSNTPGKTTLRNAPTLVNSVYAEKYFYDLREYDLERQVKHVVTDKAEFNMDFLDLADRLKESEEYVRLFKEAYGDRDKYIISSWSISNSLAAYVASLNSWNSEFDQYARGETKKYPAAAQRGFNLFMGKAACGTCHFAPVFNGVVPPRYRESESEVLGIPSSPDTVNVNIDPDPGRRYSGRAIDELDHFLFSFKTTTVRNAALTGPYMHNGVYESLDQVVDFYNRGGGAGMGMDLPHQTLPFDNLSLNKQEMQDIVAFMETLTDTTGMNSIPQKLPKFAGKPEWNRRTIGGEY